MGVNKLWLVGSALSVLVACGETVPASNGPGFGDPLDWQRENALTGAPVQSTSLSSTTNTSQAIPTGQLISAGILPETSGDGTATYVRSTGVEASPSNAAPTLIGANLSDEQDFQAVSARETIQSDAERRAALASQYEVVQPTALPTRVASGPNIVEYALTAPNTKGQEWYSRFMLSGEGRFLRNCAKYASADEAQRDFLARGGPDRDPRGLDPDGDGFACGWDPAPYIAAARSSGN